MVFGSPGGIGSAAYAGDDDLETSQQQAARARLLADIRLLASDGFEGRKPGTRGESRTLHFLARKWFDLGLVSGTNDPGNAWFQPVVVLAREPAVSRVRFGSGQGGAVLDARSALAVTWGRRAVVRAAPVLFVGYGRASDYTRAELAGRAVMLLDGKPVGATGRDDGELGSRQAALLEKGAAAVITVLDGEHSLTDVSAWRARSAYGLADDGAGGAIEAFVTREGMVRVLAARRLSLARLETLANKPGFRTLSLGMSVSMEATTRETTIRTHNLIGKLAGRHPEHGAVLLLAHWDHFGVCAPVGAMDRICNGATDNASGVAVLNEVARRLAQSAPLDRDVYFLATTGEEMGLLGAEAFAENPPLPLNRIAAAFNIDSVAIAPHGTPFAIVGKGLTALDPEIAQVAGQMNLPLAENDDANRYLRRQDGWALLQHDVPAVMVTTAYGDPARLSAFFHGRYHRPEDDVDHLGTLGGALDDARMLTALTQWFGDVHQSAGTGGAARAARP